MTDKEVLKQIKKYVKEAQKKLKLDHWRIYIFQDDEMDAIGLSESKTEYLLANVTFNFKKMKEEYKDEKNAFIVICYHEVIHVLVSEVIGLAFLRHVTKTELEEAHERLVSHLTNIIVEG